MTGKQYTVLYDGKEIQVDAHLPLSVSLHGEMPCGAHGKCGKCKARAVGNLTALSEAEQRLLTDRELADGIRLLCQVYPLGEACISSCTEAGQPTILLGEAPAPRRILPTFQQYGIAIDIGTTTLAARIYDKSGRLLASKGEINPQTTYGADVISRIELAIKDGHLISQAIREGIDSLISDLAHEAGILPSTVDTLVICGNTTMLYLLTDTNPEPLSHAPFTLTRRFGEWLCASDLALKQLKNTTRVYLCPTISAFVGADTVCAVLSTRLQECRSALLVDIGTNGEIALWHGDELLVTSTAAGPAFEGVGITCGMRGAIGAIDRVALVDGKLSLHTIGDTEPKGICGSGLVDLAACLLKAGDIDEGGYFEEEIRALSPEVSIRQEDIRQLQLAKSAIYAGIHTLLSQRGLQMSDLERLLIAGGFGTYLNIENAQKIGLLPRGIQGVCEVTGNSALDGASLLLLDESMIEKAVRIAEGVTALDLSTSRTFSDFYISAMLFPED